MNGKDALDWLYSFQKCGVKLGLDRITYISKKLGNPHQKYKVIHVGGTNGKGSVSNFLGSILNESGYSVGVYTSPHLLHISERFIVNNRKITEKELVEQITKIKPIVDEMIFNNNVPTFFEIATALVFSYFQEKDIDFAVIEVGLGGRYDATNIVESLATIITNVTMEHTDILGEKVADITFEKAGIIKNKIPIITAATEEALEIIKKIANKRNAPLIMINRMGWKRLHWDEKGQEFFIKGYLRDYIVKTSMIGEFQGENIALALAAIEQLQMNGYYISDESIQNGVKKTLNHGRMELLEYEPRVLLDVAHNPAGMQILKNTLLEDFEYNTLALVIGILSDKDIKSMLSIIVPLADTIFTTQPLNSRAFNPLELKRIIKHIDKKKKVIVKDQIPSALEEAKLLVKNGDLICVTGSLFTVGEAREYLIKQSSYLQLL